MAQIRSPKDVKQLGTILGVWAHPDDETFASGALMAAAVENGQRVICLTATKGEAGVQDESRWPANKLGEIRAKELEAGLKILGVTEHHWLTYKDGCCWEAEPDEAIACICDYINRFKPDTILTFGPDGMTGHPDHRTVCTWASAACRQTAEAVTVYHAVQTKDQYEHYLQKLDKQFNIFFNIAKPHLAEDGDCDIVFMPTKGQQEKKYRALEAMPSQYALYFKRADKELICRSLIPEAFIKGPSNYS